MNDLQTVEALIARDERATRQFFFKDCRKLFLSIINRVFDYAVDYDEFVNEFYLYLMENDAARLRQFEGRSSIYQWLKITAIRYFVAKRDRVIDLEPKKPLLDSEAERVMADDDSYQESRRDLAELLSQMSNKRYVYVIEKLVIEDLEPIKVAHELGITVDNLYNIKKRAIAALTKIALTEAK